MTRLCIINGGEVLYGMVLGNDDDEVENMKRYEDLKYGFDDFDSYK